MEEMMEMQGIKVGTHGMGMGMWGMQGIWGMGWECRE